MRDQNLYNAVKELMAKGIHLSDSIELSVLFAMASLRGTGDMELRLKVFKVLAGKYIELFSKEFAEMADFIRTNDGVSDSLKK